jgi:hypothetical protein
VKQSKRFSTKKNGLQTFAGWDAKAAGRCFGSQGRGTMDE